MNITLIPKSEFDRVRAASLDKHNKLSLIADMCRTNTLAAVKRAGSGHLGTSFSAMDIVVYLYFSEMNVLDVGINDPNRDIYFSSKGHDVPGLYNTFFAAGILPQEKIVKLRRLGGLDGHPDVGVTGIEANSGSLGMGISKGRGIAWAKRALRRGGCVFVMTGDGELQEGQNYEALQTTVQQNITNLIVIVDHNKVQSDKPVNEIIDLGDLQAKFSAFGWHVARCDGHDYGQLERIFAEFRGVTDRPKILIADTIKGRGVSFMEHPQALKDGKGYYKWHAGAPDDVSFQAAYEELIGRVSDKFAEYGLGQAALEVIAAESAPAAMLKQSLMGEPESVGGEVKKKITKTGAEFAAEAYGKALVELAPEHPELVVLDGDLAADCRVREFELAYPDRFIENGIAEQDMVSMAGGLARHGFLPVVNSFASFLAARANEQIYNNNSEKSKIIYACHYAGLIPAGPGKSHQSLRDISLFGALVDCIIVQPCNAAEARLLTCYCVKEAPGACAIRLNIGPSPRVIELPEDYKLTPGQGAILAHGVDAVLFAYGPVMLHEALTAAKLLAGRGFGLQVVNMPWLNRFDPAWLKSVIEPHTTIYVLEDHSPCGGLGDGMLYRLVSNNLLGNRRFTKFGVEGYPACGTPAEALKYHGLDGESLAERLLQSQRAVLV